MRSIENLPPAEGSDLILVADEQRRVIVFDLKMAGLLTVFNIVFLWRVAPGAGIRPMGLGLLNLVICGTALVKTIVTSISSLWQGRRDKRIRNRAILLIGAGFLPIVMFAGTWAAIIKAHHLFLEG